MTTVLASTGSVHTTAAICDYLAPRLGPDDPVLVLAVEEPGMDPRDAGDATNVARTRLVDPEVTIEIREGEPATTILDVAREQTVDEIVLGATSGDPDRAGEAPGETVRRVLAAANRPVTVLPSPAPV